MRRRGVPRRLKIQGFLRATADLPILCNILCHLFFSSLYFMVFGEENAPIYQKGINSMDVQRFLEGYSGGRMRFYGKNVSFCVLTTTESMKTNNIPLKSPIKIVTWHRGGGSFLKLGVQKLGVLPPSGLKVTVLPSLWPKILKHFLLHRGKFSNWDKTRLKNSSVLSCRPRLFEIATLCNPM